MTPNPEQTETNTPAQSAPQSVQPSAQAAPAPPTNSAPTAQPSPAPTQPQQAPAATGTYAPYTPYAQYAQQNPSGAYNPYAQYPQQPQYPQYPQYPYPQYPGYPQYPYPQYPGYPQYPYPGYPPYAPPAAPAAPGVANGAAPAASGTGAAATSATAKSRRPGLYALIFGVTLAVLLVAVIALAAIAPSFRASETSAIPQGWTRVYDANLTTGDDGHWVEGSGCSWQSDGLVAGGSTSDSTGGDCIFRSTIATTIASQGFLLNVTLAPANRVANDQEPVISVGPTTYVTFNQQGTYNVCNTQCDTTNPASIYATGSTSAWHSDGFVGNTFGVKLSADGSTLTVFANSVEVVSTAVPTASSGPTLLSIGALDGTEAIFTHATLYSSSATSL